MDFSMIIGELKCMKAKWCSYAAIFHHLKQCLNNLVSKTKTQDGIKKKKPQQNHLNSCGMLQHILLCKVSDMTRCSFYGVEMWTLINNK